MKKFFCGLFGHRTRREVRSWYTSPKYYTLHVADSVTEERRSCFCGQEASVWEEINREGLHGLTMAKEDWDLLHKSGQIPA